LDLQNTVATCREDGQNSRCYVDAATTSCRSLEVVAKSRALLFSPLIDLATPESLFAADKCRMNLDFGDQRAENRRLVGEPNSVYGWQPLGGIKVDLLRAGLSE
jgi:hypothetical protein